MKFSTLLSSSLLAGAVFSVAILPIAAIRSNSIEVKFQDRSFFSSDFQELALPYLGGVTFVSLGAGFTVLTLGGWRQSSQKLDKTQETINQLQQEMDQKKAAIEKLKFSEKHLQKAGLSKFLNDEVIVAEKPTIESLEPRHINYTERPQQISFESSTGAETESLISHNHMVKRSNSPQQVATEEEVIDTTEDSLKLKNLLVGLQDITNQIESLQAAQSNAKCQKV